jgi:cell division septation protein DedD/nucleoid DNA-binding protein
MKINLDKYIQELLLQHDCVILPGLGGFVANYKPATFDASQKSVLPPSRQILFNPNLVHNDGLLYAHVSKETDYGYKEVQAIAEVYFKTIKYEVGKGLKFVIEDLGYFFINKARKVEFAQETNDNLLLASYGLSFLNYKEFDRVQHRPVKIYQAVDEINPVVRQHRIRRWVYTGAAACLLASMILIPVKMGYLNLSSFDLNPVDSFRKEQPVQKLVVSPTVSNIQLAENATETAEPENMTTETETGSMETGARSTESEAETVEPEAETVEPEAETSTTEAPAKTYFTPKTSYHIIVGSFKDLGNAEQLKQKMVGEGFEAEVLTGENSFYRVSSNHYPLKKDAVNALASIRDQKVYKSAWILSL